MYRTKQPIRLTESQLRRIVTESVKKVLREDNKESDAEKYSKYINSDEWYGCDVSNEISLLEYGLLIKDNGGNNYTVMHKNPYYGDDCCFDDVNMIRLYHEIVEKEDFEQFCKCNDINGEKEFKDLCLNSPEIALLDINGYWGLYNIL